MRYLSVCSGIEAVTAAWHSLGLEPAAFAEIDRFPSELLRHYYPGVPNHGDFTAIRGDEYGTVNLLVGGTPCQDFSVAGLRAGLDGKRGGLTIEFARLAHRLVARARTEWLVWENVPGVLSIDDGEAFAVFLSALSGRVVHVPGGGWQNSGIVEGTATTFGIAYRVLDAQFFGVPQRRRRVFVVGHLGDWRRAAAVLFERHSLSGYLAPRRETGQVAPSIPARRTGGGGFGGDAECDGMCIPVASTGDTSHCLNVGGMGRQDYETETLVAFNNTGAGWWDEAESSATVRKGDKQGGGGARESTVVTVPCLRTNQWNNSDPGMEAQMLVPIAFSAKDYGGDAIEDGTPTLMAQRDSFTGHNIAVAFDTTQVTSKTNRSNPKAGDPCHTLAKGANAPAIAGWFSPRAIRNSDSANESEIKDGAVADCLQSDGPGAVAFTQNQLGDVLSGDVMHALGTNQNATGRNAANVSTGMAVRRLTPEECEALQGFPRGYTKITAKTPDGPRYKALGNSMAVPVMRWLGERIQAVKSLP